MARRTAVLVTLSTLVLTVLVSATGPARADDAGDALARRIAGACGVDAWDGIERLAFTWTHHPSGTARSYVWKPGEHAVAMTLQGETTEIDTRAVETEQARQAHAAFVNDHYWWIFELRLAWDEGVEFTDLGEQNVPGFDDLGPHRALRVHYSGDAGYTPGDAYVLYVDDDARSVAWAFHKSGAEDPSLVTTRQDWSEAGGLRFPTRFVTADDATFISVSDVTVE